MLCIPRIPHGETVGTINIEEAKAATAELQELVSSKKYQLDGENSFDDVLDRVCREFLKYSPYEEKENTAITQMIMSDRFIPAGSILSGLGAPGKVSLSNCYTTKIEDDSIEAIFEAQKRLARTYASRGGSGLDITVLRPSGDKVSNAAKTSTGAVSFMPLFSELTQTIGQGGRRGAMLISLDVRHPDTMKFIWSKARPEQVFGKDVLSGKTPDISGANISLKITDEFMRAVESEDEWEFSYPSMDDMERYNHEWDGDYDKWIAKGYELKCYYKVNARDIFNQICEANHLCGDPGIMFIDTMQRMDPAAGISDILKPMTTNPCGEQALPYWNNCLLGAMVLPQYVESPWSSNVFDVDLFFKDVRLATMFLDVMSTINQEKHPLKEQREADRFGRRIGLEFTGLADTFAMLGYKYGDKNSIQFAYDLTHDMLHYQIATSVELAERFGPCPALETKEARKAFISSPLIDGEFKGSWLLGAIEEHGLRNIGLNTIGPCGSISIMANNCSSGIEPVFALTYQRRTRLHEEPITCVHGPLLWVLTPDTDEDVIADKFNYVVAKDIPFTDRINVQAACQRNITQSISSTINLPGDASISDISDIFVSAWNNGLKGITVFRDGCKDGVLTTMDRKKVEVSDYAPVVKDLYDVEQAERHRVFWKGAKLYITVTIDEDGSPLEVFAKLPREAGINGGGVYSETAYYEKVSLWDSVTRLVSLLLRSGMPVNYILKQLDKSSFSMVDASAVLGRILRRYIPIEVGEDGEAMATRCPECGEKEYINEGGCGACRACGYSKCG